MSPWQRGGWDWRAFQEAGFLKTTIWVETDAVGNLGVKTSFKDLYINDPFASLTTIGRGLSPPWEAFL